MTILVRVQILALTASFMVTGKASDKVGTWEIQAHFAGDTENNASNSNPEKYTIVKRKATTYLKLDPISDVDAEGMITLTGVLEKDGSEEFLPCWYSG